jgi:hypothetical protein
LEEQKEQVNQSAAAGHDDDDESVEEVEDRRTVVAKKNLILRLKKQIELLEEKNAELEKVGHMHSMHHLRGACGFLCLCVCVDSDYLRSLFALCARLQTIGLVRSENQLLLVRFRGAHDRRTLVEKKLKQAEKELEELRSGGDQRGDEQHQVSFHHGFYEPTPQQRQRPTTPSSMRWK